MSSTYDGRGKTTTILTGLVTATLHFQWEELLVPTYAVYKHAGCIWMRIMYAYVAVSEMNYQPRRYTSSRWRRGERVRSHARELRCVRLKISTIAILKLT